MSKHITFQEAVSRFGPLVATGTQPEEVIEEAVRRIYEMGRWVGTTAELALDDADFIKEDDEHFLYLNEDSYDGMIGFRNQNRGWSIMDQTALYKNKVNAGDLALIDMGTVDYEGESRRKYRMPLGFSVDGGPYFALMKLECPVMADDTIIPIHSMGAFKSAVLAVSYEMSNDEERSQVNWQKFNQFMQLGERQAEGPKVYTMGMDSSLRRRPRQFH